MQHFIACMPGYSPACVVHVCDQLIVIVIVMALVEAAGSGPDRPVIPVEK